MDDDEQPRWTDEDWDGVRARINTPDHMNGSE